MRKREKEIRIMVSEKEYETILNNAQKSNLRVSPYIRMIAQNPIINKIDYSAITNHTKEIGEIRNSINHLIFTIETSNNYLPREIQSIVEMMEEIFKGENKLIQELRKERVRQYEKNRSTTKKEK